MLSQAHVTQDITVDQFDGVFSNIIAYNTLSFNSEEFPKNGQNHDRDLHVSIKCKDNALARVLVDLCLHSTSYQRWNLLNYLIKEQI